MVFPLHKGERILHVNIVADEGGTILGGGDDGHHAGVGVMGRVIIGHQTHAVIGCCAGDVVAPEGMGEGMGLVGGAGFVFDKGPHVEGKAPIKRIIEIGLLTIERLGECIAECGAQPNIAG